MGLSYKTLFVLALTSSATIAVSCRENNEFLDPLNFDLGTADQPLMPTTLPALNTDILTGRANPVPLSDPEQLKAAEVRLNDETAITELISTVKAAYRNGQFDSIVPLVVERQREPAQELLAATAELRRTIDELAVHLESLPADHPAAAKLKPMIALATELPIDPAAVKIDSESFASAPVGETAVVYQFEKTEEGWRVVMPGLEDLEAAKTQIAAAGQLLASIKEVFSQAGVSPEEKLAQLTRIVAPEPTVPPTEPEQPGGAPAPTPTAPTGLVGIVETGQTLFTNNRCARCHCPDGRGGCGRQAPRIAGIEYEKIDERLRGATFHPGGKFQLDDQQVADLHAYVAGLQ